MTAHCCTHAGVHKSVARVRGAWQTRLNASRAEHVHANTVLGTGERVIFSHAPRFVEAQTTVLTVPSGAESGELAGEESGERARARAAAFFRLKTVPLLYYPLELLSRPSETF